MGQVIPSLHNFAAFVFCYDTYTGFPASMGDYIPDLIGFCYIYPLCCLSVLKYINFIPVSAVYRHIGTVIRVMA